MSFTFIILLCLSAHSEAESDKIRPADFAKNCAIFATRLRTWRQLIRGAFSNNARKI